MNGQEAHFAEASRILLEAGAEQARLAERIRGLEEQLDELNGENEGIHAALLMAWSAGGDVAALNIAETAVEWGNDFEPLYGDGQSRINHALNEAEARHTAKREGVKVVKRRVYFAPFEEEVAG